MVLDRHKPILEKMRRIVDGDSTGHDIHHLERVYDLGLRIAAEEGGDKDIIGAACLTHDLHRVAEEKNYTHPRDTLVKVEEILKEANFTEEAIEEVKHCVAVHEEYDFEEDQSRAETLEAEIVQDADNLDATGAIGVGRSFMFSGSEGNPMWRPDREFHGSEYVKTETGDSTIYHLKDKVLRLTENMNTETARELAEKREKFVRKFIERFEKEWEGQD